MSKIPKLRFKEFSDEWEEKFLDKIATFSKGKGISKSDINEDGKIECIRYGQLYTIYNELIKDIVSKTNVNKNALILSNYGDIIIPASGETQIDIATASCVLKDNVALGGDLNIIKVKEDGVFLSYYLNNAKKFDIARLSQGISVVHLYSSQLKTLKLNLPQKKEQEKIASFLTSVDTKIEQLTKKESLLQDYKKGVMQKIFNQEIRFKAVDGSEFKKWENRKLDDVLYEHKGKSTGGEDVFSVSVHKGLINQIEHLGRSFSAKDVSNYNIVKPNDIVYTKSPTGDFPFGIIKQSKVSKDVIVSPLYGVFTPESSHLGYILDTYFESKINVHNYLHSIIQKGAKNTINITNNTFLSKSLFLPTDKKEQEKIANFLSSIDKKIEVTKIELEKTKEFKKALLQQMFV